MAGRIGRREAAPLQGGQRLVDGVAVVGYSTDRVRGEPIVAAKERQLHRRRSAVHAQDDHVHVQPRISGRSSMCSSTYLRWRSSARWHSSITAAAFAGLRRARFNASAARWNRLIWFSTVMSNGVVVVPSSRYPRTWKRDGFGRPCRKEWMAIG